jgi:hypothetical protein
VRRLGTGAVGFGVSWIGWVAASFLLRVWPFADGRHEELDLGPPAIVALVLTLRTWAIPGALAIAVGVILRQPTRDGSGRGEILDGKG